VSTALYCPIRTMWYPASSVGDFCVTLNDTLPVAGDRNNPAFERVAVPSNFDCIEQVNSATGAIGRNPDLDAAIVWHVILLNGSCVYLDGVLFWRDCDNADQLLGWRSNGRKAIRTTR